MITGYNTEIKHRGRLFHVQTEDKGMSNPIIESLIYIGGEILASVRNSYKDKIQPGFDRAAVLKLMEAQHNNVLQSIKEGKYDPEPEPSSSSSAPAGETYITSEHTLDEVILSLIADTNGQLAPEKEAERMELELLHGVKPAAGRSVTVELVARTNASGQPILGARVSVKLIAKGEKPVVLHQGETDKDGLFSAEVAIPDKKVEAASLVIQASSAFGFDEIRRPFGK